MRLHHVHLGRRQPRVRQRRPDHPLLRRTVRRRQTVARTVLVHRRTTHHRQHRVPLAPRVRQPLQQQHPHALGQAEAVGGRRERLAAAVRGQTALTAELHEHADRGHHGRATGQRQRALARAQRPYREVQRHQRGRARRVHGDRRSLQTEGVGQSARRDAPGVAGQQVAAFVGALFERGPVVHGHRPDVDARRGPPQGGRSDPGPLQHLPGGLQQQPLLRVHRRRLARRDAEELRVELGRTDERTRLPLVVPARRPRCGVVPSGGVPAPVVGQRGDGVGTCRHQLPELVGAADTTGVAAAHADDHHGVVVLGPPHRLVLVGVPLGPVAADPGTEVLGQGRRGRAVEDHRRRDAQRRRRAQPVAQLHGGDGVESQVEEGQFGGDRLGPPGQRGDLLAHQPCQCGTPLRYVQSGQLRAERAAGIPVTACAGRAVRSVRVRRTGLGERCQGGRRQFPYPGVLFGGQRVPFRGDTVHVQLAERGQEPARASLVPAQRPEDGGPRTVFLRAVREGGGQHGVRADLQQDVVPVPQQGPGRLVEPDGVAQVAAPVVGVQYRGVQPSAGHSRVVGQLRCAGPDRCEVGAHPGHDRVDVGGMGGQAHRDPPCVQPVRGQVGEEFGRGVAVAGDDHGPRAVVRGDHEAAVPAAQPRLDLVGRGQHRDHVALPGQGRLGLAPQGHHPRGVVQGQRAADRGRGDLADAVPEHGSRFHTVGAPQRGERHRHGEQQGLDHVGAVPGGCARRVRVAEHVDRRPVDERFQGLRTRVHPVAEHRGGVQQVHRHPGPLRALSGKHEGDPATRPGGTLHQAGHAPAVGERVQPPQESVTAVRHQCRPPAPLGSGAREGERDVLGAPVVTTGQVGVQAARAGRQRLLAAAGQCPQQRCFCTVGVRHRVFGLLHGEQDHQSPDRGGAPAPTGRAPTGTPSSCPACTATGPATSILPKAHSGPIARTATRRGYGEQAGRGAAGEPGAPCCVAEPELSARTVRDGWVHPGGLGQGARDVDGCSPVGRGVLFGVRGGGVGGEDGHEPGGSGGGDRAPRT